MITEAVNTSRTCTVASSTGPGSPLPRRLEMMKERVRARSFKHHRRNLDKKCIDNPAFRRLTLTGRAARCFSLALKAQKPLILPGERIVFTRTVRKLLGGGAASNISAAWDMVLDQGLLKRREIAVATRERLADEPVAVDFLDSCIECIDGVLDLARRYAAAAREKGKDEIADALEWVPAYRPRTFYEAVQALKLLHSATWLSGTVHVTLGRFDQYMWPYFKADMDAGRLSREEAEELIAEFFISLNKDTDLYPGVQIGDNGQSLMLGGVTRDGKNAVNDLTWIVLKVSYDVNMIDPKINLRIDKNTDLELLKEAARLTKRGLGFPQYSNDDVEIDALAAHGYDIEDARDYTVAACWEFIIPGHAMDVPNIHACSFPAATDKAIREGLASDEDFECIMSRTKNNITDQVNAYVAHAAAWPWPPSPWYSVLMHGCLEKGRDINRGGVKYYNFGIHGSGSSNGAEALAAVKKFVLEEKTIAPDELLKALETNFEGKDDLFAKLHDEGPKVGNNDQYVDSILKRMFDYFADACESVKDNGRGGIVRAGTGSAMYYIWLAGVENEESMEPVVGATADGRHVGDFFGSSLAPSPGVKVNGPISILQSFSNVDYRRMCNGGPITMELSDTVFRDEECIEKVAMLIRTFVRTGCQQLQINTLNAEMLKDAKIHPENYRNLIVRVWGWSGYFIELDECYQDQIISRHMLNL